MSLYKKAILKEKKFIYLSISYSCKYSHGFFSFKGRNCVGYMLVRCWNFIGWISESGLQLLKRVFFKIIVLRSIRINFKMETIYLC